MNCRSEPLTDRRGERYEICPIGIPDLELLMKMYGVFEPKPASQGLPPPDHDVCTAWAKGLLEMGENIAATKDGKVIGHAGLIPDLKGSSAEFVIFVHQDFRNLGIGTELSKAALNRAVSIGFKSVWLTVAITNSVAIRLYRKLGYEYCDMDDCERTMAIRFSSPAEP